MLNPLDIPYATNTTSVPVLILHKILGKNYPKHTICSFEFVQYFNVYWMSNDVRFILHTHNNNCLQFSIQHIIYIESVLLNGQVDRPPIHIFHFYFDFFNILHNVFFRFFLFSFFFSIRCFSKPHIVGHGVTFCSMYTPTNYT